jgi:hypothetical protein
MRMHLVFHVSLLKKALQNAKTKYEPEVLEELYKPERILDKRIMNGETRYLVK